jgi:hypothetical protein
MSGRRLGSANGVTHSHGYHGGGEEDELAGDEAE